jgi:DNA repair exonuclease SbcCD ATPase subunit
VSSLNLSQDIHRDLQQQVARWRGQADLLDRQIVDQSTRLAETRQGITQHEQALALLQRLEEKWRGSFEQALAAVVSHGLSTVFERELTVNIESKLMRGTSSMALTITEGENTTSILGAEGGSLVEVTDFLLRVLLTLSARPALRHLLVLDEPFSRVSENFRSSLWELLRELSRRLDFQIIMVSHEPDAEDAADRAYLISKPKDVAVIEELKGVTNAEDLQT